jgi:hypothetical protein
MQFLPEEIWKDIEGYEGIYSVSNLGRVRVSARIRICGRRGTPHRYPAKLLKQVKTTNGYLIVTLCKDKVLNPVMVHRLVAKAFIPNPDNLPEVNHEDCNKQNNLVSNLIWCTRMQNMDHAFRNGLAYRKSMADGAF